VQVATRRKNRKRDLRGRPRYPRSMGCALAIGMHPDSSGVRGEPSRSHDRPEQLSVVDIVHSGSVRATCRMQGFASAAASLRSEERSVGREACSVAPASNTPRDGLGFYSIQNWGAQVGSGVYGVRMLGYARQNTADKPFGVVNDFVASTLGTAIGLPVPPGAMVRLYGDKWGYLSMGFSDRGDQLPPVIPERLARERPWDATGIIAFDQWINNTDRHEENMAYHPEIGLAVFDHDLSLINTPTDGNPAITLDGTVDLEVKNHILARYLDTPRFLPEWCVRIRSVSRREIRRAVDACFHAGLIDGESRTKLASYLQHRQTRIPEYVSRTKDEYVNISSWTFGDGGVDDDN
jgi:hypothetical protein